MQAMKATLPHAAASAVTIGLVVLLFATDVADDFNIFLLLILAGFLALHAIYAGARRLAADGSVVDAQRDRFLKILGYTIQAALAIWLLARLLS